MTRVTRTAALCLSTALVVAACGGSSDEASQKPTMTTSPSPSSTVKVPQSVKLTGVGADLSFGATATVIYEPDQNTGTVLDLTVEKAEQGSVKNFSGFILDDQTKKSTPYYVDVKVKNVGEGAIGGQAVPVWGVDGENTLLPPAKFTAEFNRCRSDSLPKKFQPEDTFSTCLVFLAPNEGTMKAVSFRPNQKFDPIQWTGDIATPKPEPKKDGSPQKSEGSQKGDKKNGS